MQDCGFVKRVERIINRIWPNMSDFDRYNTVYISMHIWAKWPIQKLFFSWSSENRSKFNWPLELLYFAAENTKSVSFRSLEELRCLREKILEIWGTVCYITSGFHRKCPAKMKCRQSFRLSLKITSVQTALNILKYIILDWIQNMVP